MSDQLMALEKDVEEHQIALRNVNEEKNRIAK